MNKKTAALLAAAILAVAAGLIVKKRAQLGAEPPPRVTPAVVETLALHCGEVTLTLPSVADIQPLHEAVLASRLSAYLTALPLYEGQRFHRGQTLAELEPSQAEADLQRAEANLAQTRLQAGTLAADMAAASAAAEAERERDRRTRALYEIQGVSLEQRQTADANLAAAEARQQAAAAAMDGYRSLLQANAAAFAAARRNLDYDRIAAPFDGIVAQRLAQPGDLATPGKPLLKVIDSGAGSRLLVNLPLGAAPPALIAGGRELPLLPWPEAGPNGMQRFEARSMDRVWLPGSRVDVRIVLYRAAQATLVPGRCLLANDGKRATVLAIADQRVIPREFAVSAQGEEGVAAEDPALDGARLACGGPDILARLQAGVPFRTAATAGDQ